MEILRQVFAAGVVWHLFQMHKPHQCVMAAVQPQ